MFDYIHLTRYGDATVGGRIEWKAFPAAKIAGRVVLIVDDILDEGHTLAEIRRRVLASGASQCYAAVFADKDIGKQKPVAADFVGVTLPEPLRVRLRHGRQGCVAQPAGGLRDEGGVTRMLAIIGGSGFANIPGFALERREVARTPYGEPSSALAFGTLAGQPVVFLARHGYGHTIPPHQVNYRANIWALQACGVKKVLALATVGGIRGDLAPGVLMVPDQIIDYTHGRPATFFTLGDRGVHHIDFTLPYSTELRKACIKAAATRGGTDSGWRSLCCNAGPAARNGGRNQPAGTRRRRRRRHDGHA